MEKDSQVQISSVRAETLGALGKVLGFLGIALARLRAEPIPDHSCTSSSESMSHEHTALCLWLVLSKELLGWWQSLFPALGEASEREKLV